MHHCNTNTYLQHYSIKFELAIGVIRSTCLIICFEPVFFQDLDGWVTYVSNKFISFWYIYIYIYIYIYTNQITCRFCYFLNCSIWSSLKYICRKFFSMIKKFLTKYLTNFTTVFYWKYPTAFAPKCLTNYVDNNDNPVYEAGTSKHNIKRFEIRTENHFSFRCQWIVQNRYFPEKDPKILTLLQPPFFLLFEVVS